MMAAPLLLDWTLNAALGLLSLAQIVGGNRPRARLKACGEHTSLLLGSGRHLHAVEQIVT